MNLIVVALNLLFFDKIAPQQLGSLGSGAMSNFHNFQAQQEHLMIESIANAANVKGDDEQVLQGNLDPYHYDYQEEQELRPKLIVQKIGKDKQTTTYHSFDDGTTTQIPLFTRSIEDYDNDFIIFMDPAFPQGVGHYVVLRKLEAEISPQNAFIDEALSSEIPDATDYLAETMNGAISNVRLAGVIQSGEENYKDLTKDDAVENENSQEKQPKNYGQGQPFMKNAQSSQNQIISNQFIDNGGESGSSMNPEIIYEAFTITFKESIHGYVSDAEPLQLNFMSNYGNGFDQYEDEQGNSKSYGDDVIVGELAQGTYPQIELPPGDQDQTAGNPNLNRRIKRSPWDFEIWPQCLKPMMELPRFRRNNIWEKVM